MYDDDGNYIILPDPDTLPEPYFEGMRGEDIIAEIDRLQREAWEQQWYEENSSWFMDY